MLIPTLVIASFLTTPKARVAVWGDDTAIIVSLSAVSPDASYRDERSRRLL
ncbi:MAG: hypothetical protein AABZ61_07450 [Bacteroidota bacterium]